jgi:hypothetical protein
MFQNSGMLESPSSSVLLYCPLEELAERQKRDIPERPGLDQRHGPLPPRRIDCPLQRGRGWRCAG